MILTDKINILIMYFQILAAILKNGRHFNHRVLRGCIHIQYWSVVSYVLLHQIVCFYSKVQGFLLSSPTINTGCCYCSESTPQHSRNPPLCAGISKSLFRTVIMTRVLYQSCRRKSRPKFINQGCFIPNGLKTAIDHVYIIVSQCHRRLDIMFSTSWHLYIL